MNALHHNALTLLRTAFAVLVVMIGADTRAGGLWLYMGEPVALGGGLFETPLDVARYRAAVGAYQLRLTYDPAALQIISITVPADSPFAGNTFFNGATFRTGSTVVTALQTRPLDNMNTAVRLVVVRWKARTGTPNLLTNIVARVNTLVDAGWRPVEVQASGVSYLDTDGDGTPNNADTDDDDDGLTDLQEAAFGTDPLKADTDADGMNDAQDSAPLDPTNKGALIALPLNAIQSAQHGFGWGDNAYRSLLVATFTSDGSDRLLHVQGYDVDSADELSVWLNGKLLGSLTQTTNNGLGTAGLWWLPAAAQVTGVNRIAVRQKTPGETWGVTGLGLYAPGAAFGNLQTLTGGDRTHGAGFELHVPQASAGYLLGLSGYDSDSDGEIVLTLNGAALLGLPAGTNAAWTAAYQLPLPGDWLRPGDNLLLVKNRGLASENWGLRLDGLRPFGADQGLMGSILAAQQQGDRVTLLLAPRTTATVLGYRCYDIDNALEVALSLDARSAGTCPPSGDNAWGSDQRLSLSAQARHLLVLDNTRNPPGTDPWGLKLLTWLSDLDADGVPDGSDNCPTTSNPDQANLDGDALGDACDPDIDGDGVANAQDAFPRDRTEWLDTDHDGVGDNTDSAPLDATNKGPLIALPLNAIHTAQHGFGWGDNAYRSLLVATFTSDGSDRLLHVQGYDVDSADELSVWLNGKLLGSLTQTTNNALGTAGLWWLPAAAQVTGVNRIAVRQKTPGETWGVTGLGLYAPGAAFGNLQTLTGGDRTHGAGFELHVPQASAGYLLGLSGYDSDSDGEIVLTLNGAALLGLPAGTNAAWTAAYQLPLPGDWLRPGDNLLLVKNRGLASENWGLRLDGLRPFGADQGLMGSIPAAWQQGDRVTLLLAPRTGASVLSYRCYDVDNALEVALSLDARSAGTCPPSGDNAWGTEQRVSLSGLVQHLLVLDSTRNPPGTDPWGLKLLTWLSDLDADGVADIIDNCPTTRNPDQANLDGDALGDACDPDLDGDGVPNAQDAFPRDRTEWLDTDHDGLGNNADLDDDSDGYPDAIDPYPLDDHKVPPARIGVYNPATRTFLLDRDGSRSETPNDRRIGPVGQTGDLPVRGDWNGDGLDETGVYRPSNGRFYLDLDGAGVWSATDPFGGPSDLPVIGDWDGNGRDEIGVYHPRTTLTTTATFTLDLDGSRSPTAGDLTTAAFCSASPCVAGDLPLGGDWNGDRRDELGVWQPGTRRFYLDTNGDHLLDTRDRTIAPFGLAGDRPLVGDWNGDGKDEIGVYRPSERKFYLDSDADYSATIRDAVSAPFGASGDVPLSGRW